MTSMDGERKIYSVAEVNRKARMVLESGIGELWVEGELSRVTIHSSGHWYFTLKDDQAAVSCAMFRNDNARVAFRPKDGLKVQLYGRPGVFEATGRYQLIASQLEEAGKGSLQEQFEKLKARLAAEGLFDAARKKPLPLLPRRIGIVTSPTGAAVRDIINVLIRRYPNIQILLIPAKVQGAGAGEGLVKAIDYLNTRNDIDLVILSRGGGSIEDLWCFNEEMVVRAIDRSRIPLISAVGHEIDFTLADFAADVRAPTPSAAAELAVREKTELVECVAAQERRLQELIRRRIRDLHQRVDLAANSYVFREPGNLIREYRQRIGSTRLRMRDLLQLAAQRRSMRLNEVDVQLSHLLQAAVQQGRLRIDELAVTLRHRMERRAERDREQLQRWESQLRMLNPLAVLGRGYSLTRRSDGTLVRTADSLDVGDSIITRFTDGKVVSNVTEKE